MRASAIRQIIVAALWISGIAAANAAPLPFGVGAGQGVFLHVSVGDHFAIGPQHLDLLTKNEVHRPSRTGVDSDCRAGRIIGHGPRITGG